MAFGFVAINDGTYGGVYYTANFTTSGAITWTKLTTTGLSSLSVTNFKVDPFNPRDRQWVIAGNVVYGRNGGDWSSLLTVAQAITICAPQQFNPGSETIELIWPDPTVEGVIFVSFCTHDILYTGQFILKSTDYGANWVKLWTPFDSGQGAYDLRAYGSTIWLTHNKNIPPNYVLDYTTNNGGAYSRFNFVSTGMGFNVNYPWDTTRAYGKPPATPGTNSLASWDFADDPDWTVIQADTIAGTTSTDGINDTGKGDILWIDPYTQNHARLLRGTSLHFTDDDWATYTTTNFTITGGTVKAFQCTHIQNLGDVSTIVIGMSADTSGSLRSSVYALDSETDTAATLRNGANSETTYVDSVPSNLLLASRTPIWVGEQPVTTGVFVYADEQESADNAWATDIADYANLGSPMGGDRASFRDMPADGFDVYHAEDVHAATPQIHAPWDEDNPPGDGYGIISDGTKWEVSSDTIALTSDLHDAVTLDADAAAILDLQGAGGQEIGLDVQNENTVFAGPATAPANEPTFRALVLADLPSIDLDDLADVDVTGAAANDVLKFDGANWVDGRVALDELSDVDVTGADALDILHFNGATWEDGRHNIRKRTTITADTTLDDTYDVVVVDASGGDVTVTLPDAMLHDGLEYAIKRIDDSANSVTIHPTVNYLVDDSGDYLIDDNGDYLIDDSSTNLEGAADGVEIYQYDAIQVVADSNANSWWII